MYSLLTVVIVLLLGILALLWVANQRHQRLADETNDLRRSLDQQNGKINQLQKRLEDCDTADAATTPPDTAWSTAPTIPPTDSGSVISRVSDSFRKEAN